MHASKGRVPDLSLKGPAIFCLELGTDTVYFFSFYYLLPFLFIFNKIKGKK